MAEIIRVEESAMVVAGNTNPVTAYLAGLTSPRSRTTMLDRLEHVARMVTDGEIGAMEFAWHRLTFAHTSAIRTALVERYSPSTANLMLAAIRGVLKACWRLRLMDGETYRRAVDISNVKSETLPRGRALDGGEFRALFGICAANPSPSGRRDAAMLALLYGAGLRRSEAVSLQLADYDCQSGAVTVRQGKGRKERMCYLSIGARQAVEEWLSVRGEDDGPEGALLTPVSKSGSIESRPMTAQAVYARLRALARRAGVKDFSPHDLRRSFVSDLLDAGADVCVVQKLAGHANVTTTQRYDRRPEQAKRKAAELLHVPFSSAE